MFSLSVLGIAVGMSLIIIISSVSLHIVIKRGKPHNSCALNCVILMFMWQLTANHTSSTPEVTVDMKRCAAYEVTTLAKQKMVMETNPAYEQVRVN